MAKVIGIHEIELKPGVSSADFERYIKEEVYPTTRRKDIKLTYMKGDRGERAGKYLLIFEMESVAVRDRYFPGTNVPSEAWTALAGKWFAKGASFGTAGRGFTDYVILE